MRVRYLLNSVVFFLLTFLLACASQHANQKTSDKLYKKQNNELVSSFYIYHINDSISKLYYTFSNEVLVYKKTDTSAFFLSNVRLSVQSSSDDNLTIIKDTTSVFIADQQTNVTVKDLSGFVYIKLPPQKKYHLDIFIDDLNKKNRYISHVFSDKTSKETRQNFLPNTLLNEVKFNSWYKPLETVNIESLRNTEKYFTIDYFKNEFKLALPPFVNAAGLKIDYKPDSSFNIYNAERKFELTLPQNGFYHLKTNDKTREGITFFVYEPSFPKIKNAEQMIQATRYVMAKKEYENCMRATDKKAAIDKFWIELGGSNERATELIRKYYGRVMESNKLFTGYEEGWKTDRGMIYIVFGAPTFVSKRKNGEIWTYGEAGNPTSIVFTFIKVVNPFTDNDFELERNEIFKQPWYQAVDMWRQGRIYLDN